MVIQKENGNRYLEYKVLETSHFQAKSSILNTLAFVAQLVEQLIRNQSVDDV